MITNFRSNSQSLYPIQLPVRYEIVTRDRVRGQQGEGLTISIGSRTVRFRTDRELEVSRKVKLEMAWPASLPDGTSLNLWIHGRVIRSSASNAEVQVAKYEFRTRRSVHPAITSVADKLVPHWARVAGVGR
jgi:hypothetical protein